MNPEQAVSDLVRRGAMLTPAPGGSPVPVGLMRRLPDGRWFYWVAGGDTEFDGHVIEPDRVSVLYDGLAVEFSKGGEMVGYLTTIDESVDGDGAARVRQLITGWRVQYDRDPALRGFIVREMNARSR